LGVVPLIASVTGRVSAAATGATVGVPPSGPAGPVPAKAGSIGAGAVPLGAAGSPACGGLTDAAAALDAEAAGPPLSGEFAPDALESVEAKPRLVAVVAVAPGLASAEPVATRIGAAGAGAVEPRAAPAVLPAGRGASPIAGVVVALLAVTVAGSMRFCAEVAGGAEGGGGLLTIGAAVGGEVSGAAGIATCLAAATIPAGPAVLPGAGKPSAWVNAAAGPAGASADPDCGSGGGSFSEVFGLAAAGLGAAFCVAGPATESRRAAFPVLAGDAGNDTRPVSGILGAGAEDCMGD
jgi:hypothetical protein